MEKFVCGVCGYVYNPANGDSEKNIPSGTSFADLPADWSCPICGVEKASFSAE